jgi:hypothetical protein
LCSHAQKKIWLYAGISEYPTVPLKIGNNLFGADNPQGRFVSFSEGLYNNGVFKMKYQAVGFTVDPHCPQGKEVIPVFMEFEAESDQHAFDKLHDIWPAFMGSLRYLRQIAFFTGIP